MADLVKAAAAVIGTPWRLHGRAPPGWDCFGLVGWTRQAWLGLSTPDWGDVFDLAGAGTGILLARRVAELVGERLAAWTPCPPRPGAVALMKIMGRPSHVGLMLNSREMVHVMTGRATVIEPVDGGLWARRLEGFYDA